MTLNKLFVMGRRWYAEVEHGNMTHTAPTAFETSLSREQVIAAIERKTPDVIITDYARTGQH